MVYTFKVPWTHIRPKLYYGTAVTVKSIAYSSKSLISLSLALRITHYQLYLRFHRHNQSRRQSQIRASQLCVCKCVREKWTVRWLFPYRKNAQIMYLYYLNCFSWTAMRLNWQLTHIERKVDKFCVTSDNKQNCYNNDYFWQVSSTLPVYLVHLLKYRLKASCIDTSRESECKQSIKSLIIHFIPDAILHFDPS